MADSLAQAEARRKGTKSVSRKTGRPVAESSVSLAVRGKIGAIGEMTGDFTAPPQLDDARAYDLARLQMIGFFYFLTYDRATLVKGAVVDIFRRLIKMSATAPFTLSLPRVWPPEPTCMNSAGLKLRMGFAALIA